MLLQTVRPNIVVVRMKSAPNLPYSHVYSENVIHPPFTEYETTKFRSTLEVVFRRLLTKQETQWQF